MTSIKALSKSRILSHILDDNNSPVARMRLFSDGIRSNNRMVLYEPIIGDKGCLGCGNCVDACPVVREKRRFVFTLNQRTSMSLENIVGEECRRCYACVRVCPQVTKTTKEFVIGWRRVEKVVHAMVASLIFFLMTTGIFLFHYKTVIPGWQHFVLRGAHAVAGVFLLVMPVLYFLLDHGHFKRALANVFHFGPADIYWLKNFWDYLKRPDRRPLPNWKEFNTYHKFWFAYLSVMIPILGITGIMNLVAGDTAGLSQSLHAFFALTIDLLVLLHLYFKIVRRIFRDASDLKISVEKQGNLHFPFLYDHRSGSDSRS